MTPADHQTIVATWASAIATFLAVLVALFVAYWGWHRSNRDRRDAEAGQARLVTCQTTGSRLQLTLWVRNHSTEPVFDVRVTGALHPPRSENTAELGRVGAYWLNVDGVGKIWTARAELGPGGKLPFYVSFRERDGAADIPLPEGDPGVVVEFTDARGLRWLRVGAAQPRRVTR